MSDKTVIHSQDTNDYQLLDTSLKSWNKLEIITTVLSRKNEHFWKTSYSLKHKYTDSLISWEPPLAVLQLQQDFHLGEDVSS